MRTKLLILLLWATPLFAQETGAQKVETPTVWDKAKEYGEKAAELGGKAVDSSANAFNKVNSTINQSQLNRAQTHSTFMFNYGLYDLWIPAKIGATYSYSPSVKKSWEIEYLRGSFGYKVFGIDLGQVTDQRLSLLKRSFNNRNSLSFLYGIEYTNIKATLGDNFLDSISGSTSQYDVMEIATLGVTWGVGNRWQFSKGFTVGMDWFVINVPLVVLKSDTPYVDATTDPDDKEDAEDAVKFIERFPTMSFLKFQIGYSF